MIPFLGCRFLRFLFAVAPMLLFMGGRLTRADEVDVKVLQQRLERLEKQNEDLRKMLGLIPVSAEDKKEGDGKLPPPDKKEVEKLVDDYLKKKDEKAKKEEEEKKAKAEAEGYRVGTDLKGSVRWGEDVNGLCGAGHGCGHKETCLGAISVPCGRCGHPRTRKYLVVRIRPEERPENRCAVVQVPAEPKCTRSRLGWLGHSKSLSMVSPVYPPDLEVSPPLQPPISVPVKPGK